MFGLDDLIGGAISVFGQAAQNRWSAAQAQKQMAFQKEMSSTAHQREVADLKAAGLNPLLSVNAGASTPGGAMGTGESPVAAGVSTAQQLRRLKQDLLTQGKGMEVMDSQIRANDARARADNATAINTTNASTRSGVISDAIKAGRQVMSSIVNQYKIDDADIRLRGEAREDAARLQRAKDTEGRARLRRARSQSPAMSDQPWAPRESYPKLPADSLPFLTVTPRRNQ